MRTAKRGKVFAAGAVLLLALLAIFFVVQFFSQTRYLVQAFEFNVELSWSGRGNTVIFIPPFGEVRAATHWRPLALKITMLNVDLDQLTATLSSINDDSLLLESQIREILTRFLGRCTLLTVLGGALLAFFIWRRHRLPQILATGLASGALFVGLIYTTLLHPYNINAFNTPQYTGALTAAPWVIDLVDDTVSTLKNLGVQMETITTKLYHLSEQLEKVRPSDDGHELRVLHVSDIHNNPVAFDFIEKVVETFQIDLIIDTGDLTDYGTPVESELVSRVATLPVPYLFITGNHDSPRVVQKLKEEGALVLEQGTIEIEGLRIAGIADLSSADSTLAVAAEQELKEAGRQVLAGFLEEPERLPDLVAVHHPLVGEPFAGQVPVILSGHTHRVQVGEEKGSFLVNAGSTGAAGIRGLHSALDNPYSMVILYFVREEQERPRLSMADVITVHQYQDVFSLQRHYRR